MTTTWVVVANSSQARIFTYSERNGALKDLKQLDHPPSRAHQRDLTTDRPGRTFNSMDPGRHAMTPSINPKEHETQKFAGLLADELEAARTRGLCERVFLICSPAFLGVLRKTLTTPALRMIVHTLDKDLVQEKPDAILKHLTSSATA